MKKSFYRFFAIILMVAFTACQNRTRERNTPEVEISTMIDEIVEDVDTPTTTIKEEVPIPIITNFVTESLSSCIDGVVIDGIRWATRNVDAPGTFAESPDSFGMFYQWNRNMGWSAADGRAVGWDNTFPSGREWYAENDPCPTGWRIPTAAELHSLINAGNGGIFASFNGVEGHFFGLVPYHIFLPAAGSRGHNTGNVGGASRHDRDTTVGRYWSSQEYSRNRRHALHLFFTYRQERMVGVWFKTEGNSIRCVAKD